MIPLRLELENFLSFGSPPVELDFADSSLWVLSGPNGVGKSAVFDAITYALFGQHRGGVKEADQLIRHGSNGFRVVFTFEQAGCCYRLTRCRSLNKTPPPPRAERRDGDTWRTIDLSAFKESARADAVSRWAEATLGIGFDAFTASVLLRQGEADAMILKKNKERLDLLKKVIGVERYEQLSRRVHEETRTHKASLDRLKEEYTALPPVDDEALQQAQARHDEAALAHEAAGLRECAAVARVEQAKQWAQAANRQAELRHRLDAAAERLARADTLCADHARFTELTRVVPLLRQLVHLDGTIAATREDLRQRKEAIATLMQQRDAASTAAAVAAAAGTRHRERIADLERIVKQMRQQVKQDEAALTEVAALTALDQQISAYPHDLAEQVEQAEQHARQAQEAEAAARTAETLAADRLRQIAEQRQQFAAVDVGVPCARCGQPVSAEHAAREQMRLDTEHAAAHQALQTARQALRTASQVHQSARTRQQTLTQQLHQQDRLRQQIAGKRQTLVGMGYALGVEELDARIRQARQECEARETERDRQQADLQQQEREQQRHDQVRQECDRRLAPLEQQRQGLERQLAGAEGQGAAVRASLPPEWLERAAELPALEQQRQTLDHRGVAADHARLLEEQVQAAGWHDELERIERSMADLSADARLGVEEATRCLSEARRATGEADRQRTAAGKHLDELQRQAEAVRRLGQQLRDAEQRHQLHHRLDDLLGKNGLQRELVRTAERAIVRLAADTLGKLSDGELTVELDPTANRDEAFALCVRPGDDPTPIGVQYLSGSQRFRVAIAVALALGRFVTGQAQPLEAVIIDEGFGCLDRDGLRATADELNRLKRFFKRIILVSHQEEFAACFSGGYRLRRTAEGTAAERYLT